MARIRTYRQAGKLYPDPELNEIQDDYEKGFAQWGWGIYATRRAQGLSQMTSGTKVIWEWAGTNFTDPGPTFNGVVPAFAAFHINPTDYTAGSRTNRMRIRALLIPGSTAPGTVTYTFGLYPVSTWGGSAGSEPFVSTLGTVVSGSTVAVANPGALSVNSVTSGEFNMPAAGFYVLAVALSATANVNTDHAFQADLQFRRT